MAVMHHRLDTPVCMLIEVVAAAVGLQISLVQAEIHGTHLILFNAGADLHELFVHGGCCFVVLHLIVAIAQQGQCRPTARKVLLWENARLKADSCQVSGEWLSNLRLIRLRHEAIERSLCRSRSLLNTIRAKCITGGIH